MKRNCIYRLAVTGFLAVALLAVAAQPSYAEPKLRQKQATSFVHGNCWFDAAVLWIGGYVAQKVTRVGTYPSPTPPPPPPPQNGTLGGPFCGSALDPSGSPSCGM